MIPDETPPAPGSVFGHNTGSVVEQAIAAQREALDDTPRDGGKTFAQRKAEFLLSASRQTVRDRQSAADAADTIKLAGEVWSLIDADRRVRSDPFREAHLKLSGIATEFWEPVVEAMKGLKDGIDAWRVEEDKRISAQQREQDEEQKRLLAAAAPPAAAGRERLDYSAPAVTAPTPPRPSAPAMQPARRSRIHGDLGATISSRDTVIYEIEDFALLPPHITQSPTVIEAILTVVKATARHMGVPPGIKKIITSGTQIR